MMFRELIYLELAMYMKGGKELDTEITTTVEIADQTGHTTCQLTKSETLQKVSA